MSLLRQCHSFSDTFDTVSESWCSVHYSPQRPTFAALSPEPAHQRVATWLEQQSKAVQPASQSTCRQRSLSQVSLADFLRCTEPHRPSFLNHGPGPKRRVGWVVASKPDEIMKDAAPTSTGNHHPRRRIEEKNEEPAATDTDTDAEFLSHVLSHFVAFQPLDFRQVALSDQQQQTESTDKDTGGLWAYLSSALGELTRDVTFIH